MIRKIHPIAGAVSMAMIAAFWLATVATELFGGPAAVLAAKTAILWGLLVLVPVLGPVWVLVALLTVTFALGLGDTWRDFRAGAEARRPWSS